MPQKSKPTSPELSKPFNFDEGLEALQQLLQQIESEKLPLEEMTQKLAQAKIIMQACNQRLRVIEDQIEGQL